VMHDAERGGASRSKLGGDLQISLSFAAGASRTGVRGTGRQDPLFCFDNVVLIEEKPPMAKKPGTNPKGEFAFFNVVYEDDSQRSNRRVPSELLGGLDGDEPARGYIMEQDREIAEKSGRTPLAIKSISRVGAKKK
jgi:hypothetical protein